jgi:V8-like Glu-specific endopeptidase
MKLIVLCLLVVLASTAAAHEKGIKVIYGDDNRKDVFESPNSAFVELSKSTAAMISSVNLKSAPNGEILISAGTLASRGICAKERFSKQISAANCSGFLVASNILVTAGHCIKSEADCSSYNWVFDYKVDHADQGAVNVAADAVYSCKRIVERSLNQSTKDDWAVIELDRSASDRRPLSFRKRGKIAKGQEVVVIGHPTGLPTKIADGAKVRSHAGKYFVANLDTYGGNSGSAVFNVKTSEVEGILVRGETDYVRDPALGCMVSNFCPEDGCRGEDVTYITNIPSLKKL